MVQKLNVKSYLSIQQKRFHCTFLQCNGKVIDWQHLVSLYKSGTGADKVALGLSLIPKLKYEHIYLTSYSKMRVDLAAQVCE